MIHEDMSFTEPKIIEISKLGGGEKGYLSVIEAKDVAFPFDIKRVYWTYAAIDGSEKGNQANKNTKQVLIALKGKAEVVLESSYGELMTYHIDTPEKALYIPPMYWRKVIPSDDAILLNISSEKYSQEDVISDYNTFKNI